MPTVEGFTPSVLWTTIYGLLALCILFMVVYKVYDAIHTIMERRRQRKAANAPGFAEQVSQMTIDKMMERLEPRLQEIEQNLANDKRRLDNHELILSSATERYEELHRGMVAMCKFMLVISTYSNLGNNEKIKEAVHELSTYLAEQM